MRALVIFGASGQLGSAILRIAQAEEGTAIPAMPWGVVRRWSELDIRQWFYAQSIVSATDVIFANGQTDPRLPREALFASNCDFPLKVISALGAEPDIRFISIGTIMEAQVPAPARNGYVASKCALAEAMGVVGEADLWKRAMHLRLHTLYSEALPHRHMFLGQMLAALQQNRPFEMSSGKQYRQYHHAADVAQALVGFLKQSADLPSLLQINSAETLQLGTLAQGIFSALGCEPLLRIGALPDLPGEINVDPHYQPMPEDSRGTFRQTIPGILESLKPHL